MWQTVSRAFTFGSVCPIIREDEVKIKITDDLFYIADRLKEIDNRYEVFFDTEKQKFVIYALGKPQCVIPYDKLDVRTLDYVYKTRRENAEKLLMELEKSNLTKEKESLKKTHDEFENEVSRRLRLSRI